MAEFDATALVDDVSNFADSFVNALGPFMATTALFAVFSSLIMLSTFLILQKNMHARCTRILLLVTWAMYATATITWAIQCRALFAVARQLSGSISSLGDCLLDDNATCNQSSAQYPAFSARGREAAAWAATTRTLFVVNVVLADGVFLWRAYIRWKSYRVVRLVSYALPLATLAVFAADIWDAYREGKDQSPSYIKPAPGSVGLAASVLSSITRLWTATLIAWATWKTRYAIVDDLRATNVKTRTLKTLALGLEQGVLHCCLWALFIAFNNSSYLQSLPGFRILFERGGCLIYLLGIYPTLFIALLAHNSTHPSPSHTHGNTHETSVSTLVVASPSTSTSDSDCDGLNFDDTLGEGELEGTGSMRTTRSQGFDEKGFDARSLVSM